MQKDVIILKINCKNVYIAAVLEFNKDFNTKDQNAYIINDGEDPVETVIIVSQGYNDEDMTAPINIPFKQYLLRVM